MRRRNVLLTALVILLLPKPVPAQEPDRIWHVGALTPTTTSIDTIRRVTLPELAKLGFVEGRNLTFQARSANGVYENLPALALELVAAQPDVIIAVAPAAIRAARAATQTIPIVMSFAGEDPVAAGWAESYARPGGNVTGIVMLSPELDAKRIELLHDAFPMRRQIAVFHHPVSRNSPTERAVRFAAEAVGIEVREFYVAGHEEYKAAFATIPSFGVDAVAIASSTVFRGDAALLAGLALEAGLPMICEWRDMVEKGCLMSYNAKLPDLLRRTADFVSRILHGTPAGELPIENPTVFELVVNLNTAKALGIEVSAPLIAQADEVIE